jgi:hypothetical protein
MRLAHYIAVGGIELAGFPLRYCYLAPGRLTANGLATITDRVSRDSCDREPIALGEDFSDRLHFGAATLFRDRNIHPPECAAFDPEAPTSVAQFGVGVHPDPVSFPSIAKIEYGTGANLSSIIFHFLQLFSTARKYAI